MWSPINFWWIKRLSFLFAIYHRWIDPLDYIYNPSTLFSANFFIFIFLLWKPFCFTIGFFFGQKHNEWLRLKLKECIITCIRLRLGYSKINSSDIRCVDIENERVINRFLNFNFYATPLNKRLIYNMEKWTIAWY